MEVVFQAYFELIVKDDLVKFNAYSGHNENPLCSIFRNGYNSQCLFASYLGKLCITLACSHLLLDLVKYFLNKLADELTLDEQEELGLANNYYFLKTCEDRKAAKGAMRIVVCAVYFHC